MKYFKLSICLIALIIGLAWKHYLIPIASLALVIVLENDFSISSKVKMLVDGKTRTLEWHRKFLMKRYGTDKVLLCIYLSEYGKDWHCRVDNITANALSFDKLVEQLDRNMEIHERAMKSLKSVDVTI